MDTQSPLIDNINKALDYVEKAKRLLVVETRGMTDPSISLDVIVTRFAAVKDLHARIKSVAAGVNQLSDHLSYELVPAAFGRQRATTINHAVGRVGIAARTSATMIDKTGALEWLRSHDYGDLIIETVNANTLGATAAGLIEAGDELPDEYFKTTVKTYTKITKPAGSKKDQDDGDED